MDLNTYSPNAPMYLVHIYGQFCPRVWTGESDSGRALPMGSCRCHRTELVGPVEIAGELGVARTTVDKWRQRGILPEPVWEISGHPVWCWHRIEDWALDTGRIDTRRPTTHPLDPLDDPIL